jgi:KDO2-lipid IV(A) palmitoleoyltransferase
MLTVTMVRKADKSGYRLHISPEMANYPEKECEAAAFINKVIEKEIMRAPEQYLWMHRRFKTRPLGESHSIFKPVQKVSFAKKLTFSITCNCPE